MDETGKQPDEKIHSVSEIAQLVKDALKGFSRVWVAGEISGWKVYPSGHAYFKLKDASAQMSAVMFASACARCKQFSRLRDGAKVEAIARIDVYAPRGECQLVVLAARIAGEGELMARFIELRDKLRAEGLFDRPKKRIPFMPHRIGIVTSPAGAVIHDMGKTLTRRFPNLEITLFPVKVQGEGAKEEIAAALQWMDARGFDVVIVGRGGGSVEDLWAFNEEIVARAVAAMNTPTISAVGHQTDNTLCDFAADVRAGTPSIAAEMAVPVKDELVRKIAALSDRLAQAAQRAAETNAQRLDHLTQRLAAAPQSAAQCAETRLARLDAQLKPALSNALAIADARLARLDARLKPALSNALAVADARLVRADARIRPAADACVARAEKRLAATAGKLPLLDPYNPLKRGYTLTLDANGRTVRAASQVKAGDVVTTRTADGAFKSSVK
ncbi:MAG: exodeoxyribonuclease VII large subunit [Kiritimatiellae bacterium]|nr:exodeoxyribonuclease VII large subunit [Kiritimatiellia bacterium]